MSAVADLTAKGAALAAARAGDFAGLPVYDRARECAPREEVRALSWRS